MITDEMLRDAQVAREILAEKDLDLVEVAILNFLLILQIFFH